MTLLFSQKFREAFCLDHILGRVSKQERSITKGHGDKQWPKKMPKTNFFSGILSLNANTESNPTREDIHLPSDLALALLWPIIHLGRYSAPVWPRMLGREELSLVVGIILEETWEDSHVNGLIPTPLNQAWNMNFLAVQDLAWMEVQKPGEFPK